jgi:DnaJ-class molecular chaperone
VDGLMVTCPKCDGDGYLDVMDPDHYGAVIGAQQCPLCEGEGRVWEDGDGVDEEDV